MTKERFLASTIQHLAHTLETVAGVEEAEAFLSTVGAELAQELYDGPETQPGGETRQNQSLPQTLIGAEAGIGAAFELVEQEENRIVLENHTCPFGPQIDGTRSVCMVTANLLGHLASKDTGYAKIHLEKTIARGDRMCRVDLSFDENDRPGLEYFSND